MPPQSKARAEGRFFKGKCTAKRSIKGTIPNNDPYNGQLKPKTMEPSREVKLKMAQIIALAMTCSENGFECFVRYSGHINGIDIQLYDGKWDSGKEPIRTEFQPTHSDALEKCERIIYQLKNVLEQNKIDYSVLGEVERIEIDYQF